MSQLKTKLMVSAVSLLLAVALLAASAFAWFTISTNPEITGISATVAANENLEIAMARVDENGALVFVLPSAVGDSGNGYTWGNLVILSQSDEGVTAADYQTFMENFDVLRPATVQNGDFLYPVYIGNGRADELLPLTVEDTYGIGSLYREVPVEEEDDEEGEDPDPGGTEDPDPGGTENPDPEGEEEPQTEKRVYAFFLDFWFRTNMDPEEGKTDRPLGLTSADKRSSDGETGGGSVVILTVPAPTEEEDEDPQQEPGEEPPEEDGGDDILESYLEFVRHLRLAFLDITPEGIEGADPAAEDAAMTVLSSPFLSIDEESVEEAEDGSLTITANLTSNVTLLRLKKNQAKLLRVFVYLDGATLDNPDAEVPLEELSVSLNLQFALQGIELHSMDEVESNS